MPFAYLSNGPVYYEVHGSGKWLTFIHGMFASHKWWKFQVEEFSKNYRVLTVDLPGHGKSYSLKGKISLDEYTSTVAELHDHLEVDKCVLIGWSLGGIISMHYAVKYPDRVEGLVIISSRCSRKLWKYKFRNFLANVIFGFKTFLEAVSLAWSAPELVDYKEEIRRELRRGVSDEVPTEYLEELVNEMLDSSLSDSFDYILDSCIEYDVSNEIQKINVPTLILVGDKDRKTPVEYSTEIHSRIKGSILRIVPSGTHYMIVEMPKAINQEIRNFLKQIRY